MSADDHGADEKPRQDQEAAQPPPGADWAARRSGRLRRRPMLDARGRLLVGAVAHRPNGLPADHRSFERLGLVERADELPALDIFSAALTIRSMILVVPTHEPTNVAEIAIAGIATSPATVVTARPAAAVVVGAADTCEATTAPASVRSTATRRPNDEIFGQRRGVAGDDRGQGRGRDREGARHFARARAGTRRASLRASCSTADSWRAFAAEPASSLALSPTSLTIA